MAIIRLFNVHRTWEDWVGIVFGVLIGLSPWLAAHPDDTAIAWNAVLVGVAVLALSELELAGVQRWEETGKIACGLWLIASPFAFGYVEVGMLRYWHFGLGAAVTLLAMLELWQDWKLSDKQLAQHGQ